MFVSSGSGEVVSLESSPNAFLGVRPEWTFSGTTVSVQGHTLRLDQPPFRWIEGMWETELELHSADDVDRLPRQIVVRVSPDTLRRWKAVAINPFLEACAQVKEHLERRASPAELSILTLL
jgi:hypothetical protein